MVPFSPSYRQQFDRLHQESYGYTRPPGEPIEIVNLRARVTGYLDVPIPAPQDFRSIDPSQALLDHFPVFLQDQPESIPCYLGERLLPGNQLTGPALILRSDTVILLPEGTHASVDGFLNVILSI